MRNVAGCLLLAALAALGLEGRAAAMTIVFDPAPLTGTRSSDLPETLSGANEHYDFSGTANNSSSVAVQLTLRARADGADIPGSDQTFPIPPMQTTTFTYHFIWTGHPAPSTAGLTFSASSPLAFVAGTFTWSPGEPPPPQVPAAPRVVVALLGAALLLAGGVAAARRAPLRR
jgi:hypothetical protein